MSQVIDLDLDLPPASEAEIVGQIRVLMQYRGQKGVPTYLHIFGPRMARALELTLAEVERMWDELSPQEFESALRERTGGLAPSLPDFVEQLDDAGVEGGLIGAGGTEK